MRTSFPVARAVSASALLLALVSQPALAQSGQRLLAYDGLDYGVTGGATPAIDGADGGAGWQGAWFGINQLAGLASYWTFDDTTNDMGPLQSHGVPMGATFSADVPPLLAWSGKSMSFVGANSDWVDVDPHLSSYTGLFRGTIAAWVKTSSTGALTLFSMSDSTAPSKEVSFGVSRGTIFYDVRGDLNSFGNMRGSTPLADGVWHHIAVTVGGNGTAILYVDGTVELTRRQGFFGYLFNADTLGIGRNVDSGGPQWHFDGLVDDLAIWGSALTPADIATLASGTAPPLAVAGPNTPLGPNLASANLTSGAFGTFDLAPVGNRLSDASGNRAGRLLNSILDLRVDATYYVSCLLRREDQGGVTAAAEVQFADSGAVRSRLGWDSAGNWVCGIGSADASPVQMQDRTTYFCVLKIDATAANPDQALLKAYAPGDTVDVTDAGFSGVGSGATDWTQISVASNSGATMNAIWLTQEQSGGVFEVDEIRIGSDWESVTSLGYGSGCLGAKIGRSGRPVLGSNTYQLLLTGAQSNVAAAVNLGLSRDLWLGGTLPFDLGPLGGNGCFLLASTEAAASTTTSGSGTATFTLPIPNQSFLNGAAVFGQWLALDPGGPNALPARLSNAIEVVFER